MDALYKDQDEIINTLFDIIKRFMIQPSILKQDMIHEPRKIFVTASFVLSRVLQILSTAAA